MSRPPSSKLDAAQILPAAFDDDTGTLRTSATLAPTGSLDIVIDQSTDSIRVGDGDGLFTGTQVETKRALDVAIITGGVTGQIQLTGLSEGISTTVQIIGSTPTKVPNVALNNRNGLSVRVWTPGGCCLFWKRFSNN